MSVNYDINDPPFASEPNDPPFASEPAEAAYQAAIAAGATMTRDQFRKALQVFTLEQLKSAKRYEEWRKEQNRYKPAPDRTQEFRDKLQQARVAEEQQVQQVVTGWNIQPTATPMSDMTKAAEECRKLFANARMMKISDAPCSNHWTGSLSGICPDCGKS